MNKRNPPSYYDDADEEDFELLGSRFMHAVQDHSRKLPPRARRDADPMADRRSPRLKPRPARDRTY